jgi:hypothetical protein
MPSSGPNLPGLTLARPTKAQPQSTQSLVKLMSDSPLLPVSNDHFWYRLKIILKEKMRGNFDLYTTFYTLIGIVFLITRRLALPPRGYSDYSRMKTTICGLISLAIYTTISLLFAFTGMFRSPSVLFSVIYILFITVSFVSFLTGLKSQGDSDYSIIPLLIDVTFYFNLHCLWSNIPPRQRGEGHQSYAPLVHVLFVIIQTALNIYALVVLYIENDGDDDHGDDDKHQELLKIMGIFLILTLESILVCQYFHRMIDLV